LPPKVDNQNKENMKLIEIAGNRYQVRVTEDKREVLYQGTWISTDKFVDELFNREEWGQVGELLQLSQKISKQTT